VPDGLMAIWSDDDLIRYTKYSTVGICIQKKREKDTTTHSEKEETQEGGGVNTMPSFIAGPLASFFLFFFYFPSTISY